GKNQCSRKIATPLFSWCSPLVLMNRGMKNGDIICDRAVPSGTATMTGSPTMADCHKAACGAGANLPATPARRLTGELSPVDIHRSHIMVPTKNSMDANESTVF